MAIGLVGRKVGMTRVFNDGGDSTSVTVLEVTPNRVTQVRNMDTDGYTAVQMTVGNRRPGRVTKAMAGHFAKAGVEPGRSVAEFSASDEQIGELTSGSEVSVAIFNEVKFVDVTATSKGKGFAGVMKRHGFRGGRATHGCSISHRAAGSTGQNQSPGKVFRGKKMAGQMGSVTKTQQNLEVVRVDEERNMILLKGCVPGSKGADIIIRPAVKKSVKK
ncbi:MAG: 50S ribosomal protein L3 [Gammaproteobacteria bacterium]|nr:MAG: 50S ribosomal protein L3 [Gammaproteobacteria bacterium]